MVYTCSDIHGCYDKYSNLLTHLPLRDDDTLYILGDVIDRGPDGIKILEDIMARKNVTLLMGNHEDMAYSTMRLLMGQDYEQGDPLVLETVGLWLYDNGGLPTWAAFQGLPFLKKKALRHFIRHLPVYKEIMVNNRKFFLSHTVPGKDEMQHHENLPEESFLWGEAEYGEKYFEDKMVITGHVPTGLLDSKHEGKNLTINGLVDLDCGAVFGHPLGCLCLDTMEEFYVE